MNRFRPLSVALAAGLALASGAQAQSSLNLYGILDLSVGSFETSYNAAPANAKSNRVTQVESGKMTTSFIGFKGTEDLGGGLKANFMLESFLRLDTGAQGRSNADVFWARNANVGLSGGFGKLVIGRMDNFLFQQALAFNPYGGSFGYSPTIRMTFGGPAGNDQGDSGWSNSIAYYTPDFSGLKGAVQLQLGESTTEANSVGLMGSYTAGPLAVGLGYQSVKSAELPKANFVEPAKQTFLLLGTSYDFGVVKAFAQYGAFDGSGFATPAVANAKTKLFQLGASVPVGKDGKVLASYGHSTEKMPAGDVKHAIITLGYDHNLSKRTDLYAVYMNDKEDVKGWKAGNTVAFGIRTKF
jgi:predicted porin